MEKAHKEILLGEFEQAAMKIYLAVVLTIKAIADYNEIESFDRNDLIFKFIDYLDNRDDGLEISDKWGPIFEQAKVNFSYLTSYFSVDTRTCTYEEDLLNPKLLKGRHKTATKLINILRDVDLIDVDVFYNNHLKKMYLKRDVADG